MTHDLVGIRPEDLDPADRAQQRAALGAADAREEHEWALGLGEQLRALDAPRPSFTARDVLRRARPRQAARRRPYWAFATAAGTALAAAAVALIAIPEPAMRDKGVSVGGRAVHLEAAVEGPSGVRALAAGEPVGPDERVVFRVRAGGRGYLALHELETGQIVWPARGESWPASDGVHVIGGSAPLAWRPDTVTGAVRYQVWFCEAPPGEQPGASCATDAITVEWLP